MVRARASKVLEPIPSLILWLAITLGEQSNIYPQLGGLPWWEVLAKKGHGECIPCSKSIWLLILKSISSSISQREWKESQADCICMYTIDFDSVTLRKEVAKVHVGILIWVTSELVSLYQRDQGWS